MTLITGPNGSIYADKERLIFKEPIGPVSTDDARPLIEERILDVARIAIYKPDFYEQDRTRLVEQLRGQYMDGQIRIPYDPAEMTHEDALEAFIDASIAERIELIEAGVDRSTFNIQLTAVKIMAGQLARQREQNRNLEKAKTALRDGIFDAHVYLSTLLSPEQLAVVDQKLGLKELVVQARPVEKPHPSFESVMEEGIGMPAGTLDKTRLVKPPQSAEVELVNTELNVA
jgi:hypothetical protein